ncbi:hypothetical protein QBC47DRAFT_108911 [Echria macrotheca]|uniref:Uncharacterized protein n=1 Tax=Echria macrotheca TaxID=438768 RepID=A0AAJ0BP77_9PEZI|nr:hypothetical protein QBC47DRAFT_108911 [Echria macrotheca]
MSTRSDRSSWTSTSSRAPGGHTRVRECRLPNHWAINTLVWATGRRPSKVKSLRHYRTTWPDDASDTGSNSSFWSSSSWGSQGSFDEFCFVESTRSSYYYDDDWDDGRPRKSKKKRGSAKKSKRKHVSSSSSEEDSDDDSDTTSLSDYGGAPPRGVPPFRPPGGMPGMPPMNRGPPMGGPPFGGGYGGPPVPGGPFPRPMSGFGGPPHPPGHGPGMPQPGFAQGRGGIQVVGVDP